MKLFFALLSVVQSLFVLRYCEKNKHCCNEYGIWKTSEWDDYLKDMNVTNIYTISNGNTCDIKFKETNCNKTYVASHIIKKRVKHLHYCIGDEDKLIKSIKYENVIVMWRQVFFNSHLI